MATADDVLSAAAELPAAVPTAAGLPARWHAAREWWRRRRWAVTRVMICTYFVHEGLKEFQVKWAQFEEASRRLFQTPSCAADAADSTTISLEEWLSFFFARASSPAVSPTPPRTPPPQSPRPRPDTRSLNHNGMEGGQYPAPSKILSPRPISAAKGCSPGVGSVPPLSATTSSLRIASDSRKSAFVDVRTGNSGFAGEGTKTGDLEFMDALMRSVPLYCCAG